MSTLRGSALVGFAIAACAGVSRAQAALDWFALAPSNAAPDVWASEAAVDAQGNVCVAYRNIAGPGVEDIDVAQYSPAGALNWSRHFDLGSTAGVTPMGIAVAPNGEVGVCGWAWTNKYDLFVLRYDSAGNPLHRTVFPGFGSSDEASASALAIDAQGNIVIAGHVTIGGSVDMLVQAYSPTGALLWDQRIAGAAGGEDFASAVLIDANGDIFVAGSVGTLTTVRDAAVAKLSSNGTAQWFRTWGSNLEDHFSSLASDHQGGVAACGTSNFLIQQQVHWGGVVARFDAGGSLLWEDRFPQTEWFSTTDFVLVDSSGVTWALHFAGMNYSQSAVLTRHSPTGVRLSTKFVASSAAPGGLVAGDAGQVFAVVSPTAWAASSAEAVVSQYDTEGELNWQQSLAPVAGWGSRMIGLVRAPNARLVLHGCASSSTNEGLVVQVDVSDAPHGFCAPKLNSLGCAPNMEFTGAPSASASSGFAVRVENVLNQKPGLFLYSVAGAVSLPFGGGTLCVAAPVLRTISVASGGSPVGTPDCSGTFAIDMNAFAHGALGGSPAPELTIAGTPVWQQAWGRDNGFPPPNNVSLSSGLSYVILP